MTFKIFIIQEVFFIVLQNEESSKTATDKLKTGFTSLMDGITKVLTVEPEDTSPPKTKTQPAKPDDAIFDRSKVHVTFGY